METENQNQLTKVSEQSVINTLPKKFSNDAGDFLSVYCDKPLTKSFWESGIKQLKAAFPSLQDEWFNLLTLKMKEKKFTQQQFKDAIDNVITNCKYPTPQIADVLNYQKGVRIISRERFLHEANGQSKEFYACFTALNVDGDLFYANSSELKKSTAKYELWNKPVSTPAKTIQTVPGNQRSGSNQPEEISKSLGILADFDKAAKLYETDPDYIELAKAKKEAQMAWGNSAVAYDKAMDKIKFLERKLKIA